MPLAELHLKKNEDRRLRLGHLWIYSNEVATATTPLNQFSPGEQALVRSHEGKVVGVAYINPHSLICGRLVSRDVKALDLDLLQSRLQMALALRERLFSHPSYRLVYGESDLLPGLVVDRYGDHLSVQLNTAGMERLKPFILQALKETLRPQSILLRNDSSVRPLEGLPQQVEVAYGQPPEIVELVENGVPMLAPLAGGQKTGWFYDQRDNRARLRGLVSGLRVLDLFSYVGSFGVQAACFGASRVLCVDASAQALEMVKANARHNQLAERVETFCGDAFEVVRELREEGQQFEVVVVDPPAFIKRKKDHRQGFRAYQRITEQAARLVTAGGLLLTASCSMHLQREELRLAVQNAAASLGRHIQILAEGSQGPDHPVHPAIPETSYLKALLCRIW